MRYVNLMGGRKPHLLVKTINNLGAETRVDYARFDQVLPAGQTGRQAWITRLPFPVHVVERVETYDHISRNRFVTRYAYHHGYFDGEEREFRGFGMVEQWDTEQFAALADGGVPADNIDAASHVPPVHTKTWFHTGVYLGREHVSDYFAGLLNATDQGDTSATRPHRRQARAMLLGDTELPAGLTLEEEREACRALKGSMCARRSMPTTPTIPVPQEQIERARRPYTVTEQNFTIRPLQLRGSNRHAVFFTHARESLGYHYERNQPRIQHALTLEVDDYGNVLKQAPSTTDAAPRRCRSSGIVSGKPRPCSPTPKTGSPTPSTRPTRTATRSLRGDHLRIDRLPGHGPAGRYQASDFVELDPAAPNRLRHKFTAPEVLYETPPAASAVAPSSCCARSTGATT